MPVYDRQHKEAMLATDGPVIALKLARGKKMPYAVPGATIQDKLDMTIEAIMNDPSLRDDEQRLASVLGLHRAESARFWKLKAIEILRMEAESEMEGI